MNNQEYSYGNQSDQHVDDQILPEVEQINQNEEYNDTQAKQDYLRAQIIDLNYDQNLFAQFLLQKKPECGFDPNLYTWDEIYQYVNEFQTSY